MKSIQKFLLVFLLFLTVALSKTWGEQEFDEDLSKERGISSAPEYSWMLDPLVYKPNLTKTQEHYGLLKFPDIDACVYDRIAGEQRKYWYSPAYIDCDLALIFIGTLVISFALLLFFPFIFKCLISDNFLKYVSGEKYNDAFAGSLYLGWYAMMIFAATSAAYIISGRFKIEIVWCYDSPHTYRNYPTSMQTEIDIPLIVEENKLEYSLTISEGFLNSAKSAEEMMTESEVYECSTTRIEDFTRLICKFEDIASFSNGAVEHLYFKFNPEQINTTVLGKARIVMLNKYGYDGIEDPARRQQMAYYERYEILKEGVDIPTDMASKMKVKLIPTQYQNNIRDFHYMENKQHLVSLKPNPSMDDETGDLHVEFEFDMDKRVMRYESRSLLITITQSMSLFSGLTFIGLLYIDLMKKWRLGVW